MISAQTKCVKLQRLKRMREASGITMKEAAEALDIRQPSYWKKEKGINSFTVDQAKLLADLLKTNITDLFFDDRSI